MADIIVKTDGRFRDFKYRSDVPKKVLKSQFDYLDPEVDDGFFSYRGHWYHTSQFMRASIPGWDGVAADGFFSGVLIKISSDGEQFKVGTYRS